MKFAVVNILLAGLLFTMAAANNVISGNNLSNKQQTSSTSVLVDGNGGGSYSGGGSGVDNVITGNNNHDHVQSDVRSTVYIDKNGNRQETYQTNVNNQNGHNNFPRYPEDVGGGNVISGNNNHGRTQSDVRTSTVYVDKNGNRQETYETNINQNGYSNPHNGAGAGGGGGGNLLTGNSNKNNVQTSVRSSTVLGNTKDNSNVSDKSTKEDEGFFKKVKNFFG